MNFLKSKVWLIIRFLLGASVMFNNMELETTHHVVFFFLGAFVVYDVIRDYESRE